MAWMPILFTEETGPKWIPCEERLPEEHESYFAKIGKKGKGLWQTQSDPVLVTAVFDKDGTRIVETAYTKDGKWDVRTAIIKRKVIAWMPMPEPYEG